MLGAMSRRRTLFPLVALALVACRADVPAFPAEQVLQNAVTAGAVLTSAAYQADVTFAYGGGLFGNGGGVMRIEGALNDGGRIVSAAIDTTVRYRDAEGAEQSLHAIVDTVSIAAQRFYFFVRALQTDPADAGLLDPAVIQSIAGAWWMIAKEDGGDEISVAPSARLLQSQASVVRVTRELGVERLSGEPTYHYGVALDPERLIVYLRDLAEERGDPFEEQKVRREIHLLQATGELWISAKDFRVMQVRWEIPSLTLPEGSVARAEISVKLSQFGSAAPVEIPPDARPFPSGAILVPAAQAKDGVLPIPESDIRSAIDEHARTAISPPSE